MAEHGAWSHGAPRATRTGSARRRTARRGRRPRRILAR
ncbi:Hypothetical protein A7982_03553 [Minicystis rosea]|nr:Hypothetical protein A7982_03553 [Minicystis rosea]